MLNHVERSAYFCYDTFYLHAKVPSMKIALGEILLAKINKRGESLLETQDYANAYTLIGIPMATS